MKTGSPISASEYQAPTDREFISNYPKALLPEDLVANVSTARCGPEAHLLPSRRPRATDCIAAIGAIIAVVAVTCFGLDFQKWVQKLSAQLTQSSDTRSSLVLQKEIHNGQRAWVGLTEATVQPLTANGGGFTIKLQNTGKTAALDLQISDVITIEDVDQFAELQEPNITARHSVGTLMPGAIYVTDVWFKTSPEAVFSLTHDRLRAVNFVRVTYKDVFQRPHATKVCFYWHCSLPRVKPCEGFNELN